MLHGVLIRLATKVIVFRETLVNSVDADTLAPCLASSSEAMVLTMYDKRVLGFREEEF